MGEGSHRILIVDIDPDTLITLQHVLEDAGVDTTVTWDEAEARQLVRSKPFDLILVGDHPPELTAEAVLRDFRSRGTACPCLILRGFELKTEIDRSWRGAIVAIPKWDPLVILEEVRKHLQTGVGQASLVADGLAEAGLRQVAS
jgi:CheY-like chemotaxis protein